MCSETCALDLIGATYVRDIEPGEIIVFDEAGAHSHKPFPPKPPRPCIFEYIYFSRPDSIVGGRSVYDVRKAFGAQLARESHVEVDVVVPYDRGDLVNRVHTAGEVITEEHTGDGTALVARVNPDLAAELAPFEVARSA